MNALTPIAPKTEFTFHFGEIPIRGIGDGATAVFVAQDVAQALKYRDASNMNRILKQREKGTHSVSTPGGVQRMSTITEPGLFRAIMQRKVTVDDKDVEMRRAVEEFQDWVLYDVLPALRAIGTYSTTAPVPAATELPPTAAGMLEALKDPTVVLALIAHHAAETLAEREAHALTHAHLEDTTRLARIEAHGRQVATAALADLHVRVDADRPKILAHERLAMASGDRSLSEAAVEIGVDRIRIIDRLLALGFLVRGGDRRVRCSREGRLSRLVRPSVEPVEGDDGREILRGEVLVTASGFAALAEHFCRGSQATSQDVIPGL